VASDLAGTAAAQDVYLRGTFARSMARAVAGATAEVYGFAARVLGELMPDSAIDWGVTRWARIVGVQRLDAQPCVATVTVTFLAAATLPSGSTITRQSDGAEYTTTSALTRGSAGTSTVEIEAVEAGAAGTIETGDVLVISSPPTYVFGLVTISSVDTDGADIETIAALKTRVLARLASPPQGGAEDDYVAWAQAYDSTIERVWVRSQYPYLGAITVYFAIAGDDSAMVPSGGAATALQTELRRLAPVHSAGLVTVTAPTGRSIEIDVSLTPDNATVQGYVEDELRSYLRNWSGEMDGTGQILEDDVRNAIRLGVKRYSATGTFVLNTIEGASPADITLAAGVLPYLGTVTF